MTLDSLSCYSYRSDLHAHSHRLAKRHKVFDDANVSNPDIQSLIYSDPECVYVFLAQIWEGKPLHLININDHESVLNDDLQKEAVMCMCASESLVTEAQLLVNTEPAIQVIHRKTNRAWTAPRTHRGH